ncbi:uncharacterized protein [Taeniopygia guttata]|uniref:uncharacterized protein n=1 Tax=Taeniopygia guttata TaxID=59729 RepID=UPI003BB88F8C
MPPLPTPSRTQPLSASPHRAQRSLPARPRRSEIDLGRSPRPGKAQSGQSSPALLFPAPRGGGSALTTRAGLPAAPTGPLSSGTPGLPQHPAAAPPVVHAGPGAAPPSPAAAPLPLRQRPSCASTARLTAHLPPSLSLRTTRPFLRPPSPATGTRPGGTGRDGEKQPSHGPEPVRAGRGSYRPSRAGYLALPQGRSPMSDAFLLSGTSVGGRYGCLMPSHLIASSRLLVILQGKITQIKFPLTWPCRAKLSRFCPPFPSEGVEMDWVLEKVLRSFVCCRTQIILSFNEYHSLLGLRRSI